MAALQDQVIDDIPRTAGWMLLTAPGVTAEMALTRASPLNDPQPVALS